MDFSKITSLTLPEGPVAKITRGGVTLWEAPTGGLPADFQQVEYITADGSQWVDTGIYAANYQDGIYCDMDFMLTTAASGNTYRYFYGHAQKAHNAGGLAFNRGAGHYRYYLGQGQRAIFVGATNELNDKRAYLRMFCNSNDLVTSTDSVHLCYADDPETNLIKLYKTYHDATCLMPASNMYLFNANGYETNPGFAGNFYSFKMTDAAGVPLRDFVPCYRKADGVIGVYDLVSGAFFENSGTGSFTKGADV